MKVKIELNICSNDAAAFEESLMFFIWNNPSAVGVDSIEFDGVSVDFLKTRQKYSASKSLSMERVLSFQKLINGKNE